MQDVLNGLYFVVSIARNWIDISITIKDCTPIKLLGSKLISP